MRYATTPRLPRQQYLVVDKDDHEVTRLPTLGVAARFAADLDRQFPDDAPHWVRSFRDLRRSVA